jgi:spermidine synthase
MGLEILWLRHATLLLGGFRAVFSLLLTVMLVGLGAGSLAGGWLQRRSGRPAEMLMAMQALFVAAALFGIAAPDASALTARGDVIVAELAALGLARRAFAELWFNARPILMEVALPALLAGFAFPLANSLVQRVEQAVGRRAGLLYLANTAGAVCGSLVTGYVLLPRLGVQSAATVLVIAAALPIGAFFVVSRARAAFAVSAAVAVVAIAVWLTLPGGYILERALTPQLAGEQRVAVSEGATELIEVVEIPGRGRGLLTNGHAMASTAPLDQRYMRALAHIPLLAMPRPERVLVIGFGVGNSVHAASLHPSVSRIDVADLSRHVLNHAGYFRDANHDVLASSKVSVYVNDGRQHLQMVEPATYDLITLEPPPIAYAGVAALYSREFYQLARSRLRPGGYLSQWLPAYQVPAETSLAMVRAFIDVFPQTVLLSGTQAELLLLGTTAPRIEIDPAALEQALQRAPAVQDDLTRLDLGSPTEIIGSFVGSPTTLRRATQRSAAVTDDRPQQEYGVRSRLAVATLGVPASLFDLDAVGEWCPRCFDGDALVPQVEYLDTYLRLLQQAYTARQSDVLAAASATPGLRRILGSAYLGAALPASEPVAALLDDAFGRRTERGRSLLAARRFADAAVEFRGALEIRPDSAAVENNLGVALASQGRIAEAAEHFARAVELDPGFAEARRNLAAARR